MKKIKILIIYFPILSSFFGLSYKKENKLVPNEYRYNSNNSLFASNLEKRKELKHNSFKQYNNQNKKNYKTFSFQYENKYNKKNENKKASNLFINVSRTNLSFGTSLISPHFAHIKGINPHISKIYNIKGEKKNIDLNSPTYSFTQSNSFMSIHNDVISNYNNLIKMINENYNKAKDAFVYSNSCYDMSRYIMILNNENYDKFMKNIYPKITSLNQDADKYIKSYEEVKKDMRKRINHLQLLEGENGKRNLYENELLQFKKKIEEKKRNENVYGSECEKKRKDIFYDLKKYIVPENCPKDIYNKVKNYYEKSLKNYLSVDTVNNATHSESLKEMEDYFNNQNLLLKLMEGNFYEKKVKYDLNLLMEEINDIKDIYKNHTQIIRDNIRDLKNYEKNAEKRQFIENLTAENLMAPSYAFKGIIIYSLWNTKVTADFIKKKKEFDNLFRTEYQKIGNKISKLVYPENLISESKQIISNSQGILTDVKRIIDKDFEKLENLLYNCDSFEFSAIKKELTQLYAELTVHNTSIKNKFDSMNKIYISITNEKPKIENKKKNILEKGNILNMNTRDVLIKIKEIQDIIASASNNLNLLKRNYEELKNLKKKIENLKIQVQTKKNKLKELKRQEGSRKEESIKKIREKLKEIKKKIEDFKPIINLKDSENEDLKFIEKLIYDKPFNKNEFIEKKKKAHEQINLALNSLFGNGLIDELKKISQFVAEKEVLNYKELRLSRIIEILDEIMKMSSKVNKIISDAMSTLENKVNPAKKNIIELKNYIITKSIEDLHIKMENSIDNFSRMSNELSENITDYETKKKTLENYENDIKIRKNELLSNIINDNILFEKKDISFFFQL
ncbi:reticulocyte binding protein, putative [Plasmodium gallinaceum]|uniref:Reticulocyte binding protein, putative n=1 Tax=Plasmodium gallinaceum TaxID=5849 RepID=A0A1J1GZW0_PLAGA|nr:reticulocyte binding protein, putative [Plasmodium gallinaceum]CRG96556.1 reticulocyte binding protein, putative [Plasmodium gallinaceum]